MNNMLNPILNQNIRSNKRTIKENNKKMKHGR